MARRTCRTAMAIMAVSMIGLHARQASAHPAQPADDRRYDIPALGRGQTDHPVAVTLTGAYHNLLRRWTEV